eukprot:1348958-Rhodomonas_salina.1
MQMQTWCRMMRRRQSSRLPKTPEHRDGSHCDADWCPLKTLKWTEKAITGMSPRSTRTIMWMKKEITQMRARSMRTMMPH